MDTIFMNSENSKTSDPHRLLLNISDKINLKRSDKYVAYQILAFTSHWQIQKNHTKTINLKYLGQRRMKNLNFPDGSYSVSDIQDYFEYIMKKHELFTDIKYRWNEYHNNLKYQ